jgi:aspartyl-tRNA(Asn)/glutamyl-tRNA(Gln) amidotransferase subunit C
MVIDNKLLDRLAKLSSLELDDKKRKNLTTELEDILSFVENLNEIDVSNITATFSTLNTGTKLREDEVILDTKLADSILNNAPKSEDNYFIVPKIIE